MGLMDNRGMEQKKISVTGRGSVHVEPDVTRMELSLISLHDSYNDAYNQARNDLKKLQDILKEVRLSGDLPKTVRLDIDKKTVAEYDKYKNYKGEKFIGFQLTHLVKIEMGMDCVMLNSIIKSISKHLRQAEIKIGYTVSNPESAQLKLLELAVKDARIKAEVMAAAAGCRLGDCLSVDYAFKELQIDGRTRTIHEPAEASCCTPELLDAVPEDLVLFDTVNVVWALENESGNE